MKTTTDQKNKIIIAVLAVAAAAGAAFGIYKGIQKAKEKKADRNTLPAGGPAPAPLPGETTGGGSGRDQLISARPEGIPSIEELKSPEFIRAALQEIKTVYGVEIARNVERIYRQETGFKSGQYINSGSAGMAAASQAFPYGWSSLRENWEENPDLAPVGMIAYKIGRLNGDIWRYLAFKKYGGFHACAAILYLRDNDPGRYAATDPNHPSAVSYRAAIAKITPKYV